MDWQSVLKYNPHHDPRDGRFTSGDGGNTADRLEGSGEYSFDEVVQRNLDHSYQQYQERAGLVAPEYKGKSALAVELALTEKYPGKVFNLHKGVPYQVREAATALDKLAQDYPDQFKNLKGVSIEDRFSTTFALFSGAWAEMTGDGKMFLNPKVWGLEQMLRNSGKSLPKQLNEAMRAQFHPQGTDSISSIIDHEFGHHFMNEEGRQSKRSFGLLVQELQHLENRANWQRPENVLNSYPNTLGDYSKFNQNEWFACAFAYARGRSSSKYKGQMANAFSLYLKDYREFVTAQKKRWMDPTQKRDLDGTQPRDDHGRWTRDGMGDEVQDPTTGEFNEPKVGDTFLVYRVDRGDTDTPAGKNAANAVGVIGFYQDATDMENPGNANHGDHLSAYEVKLLKPFGEYVNGGGGGSEIGRSAKEGLNPPDTWGHPSDRPNPSVWYSFPYAHVTSAFSTVRKVGSIPITEMQKRYGRWFDSNHVRDVFKEMMAAKKEDIAQTDLDQAGRLNPEMGPKRKKPHFKKQWQFGTVLKFNPNHDKLGRFAHATAVVDDIIGKPPSEVKQILRGRSVQALRRIEQNLLDYQKSLVGQGGSDNMMRAEDVGNTAYGVANIREQVMWRNAMDHNRNKATFFHGTNSMALESILTKGLQANPGGRNYSLDHYRESDRAKSVYMVTREDSAESWAAASTRYTGTSIVLKLRIPKEERDLIVPDELIQGSVSTFRIPRDIPPEWIVSYKMYDSPKESFTDWKSAKKHRHSAHKEEDGTFYVVVVCTGTAVQMNANQAQKGDTQEKQYAAILKFNPYHADDGKFTTAQMAKLPGHDEMPTVDAMNLAMQYAGMDHFERAVINHLASLGRELNPKEQAHEIERVAREIVAMHHGKAKKCEVTMPLDYFLEIAQFYYAHKRDTDGTQPRDDHGRWRDGTGMYFDDRTEPKVWRYGGDHSEVPANVSARLRSLAIPPASINVHLNPDPDAPMQATWTAKNGKLQYKYHAANMAENAAEKFSRLKDFNAALPKLRSQAQADMVGGKDRAARDTAAVVRLMDKTGFRVGGEHEFETRKGKAYGASTLLDEHVVVTGTNLRFKFPGKHAVVQEHEINDALLAQYIRARKRETRKEDRLFVTSEGRVNAYLKQVTGDSFSAKDFRTWHGTMTALRLIKKMSITTEDEYRKARVIVGDKVSSHLGNTRAVALESYIDPTVWGKWLGKEKKKAKTNA